MGVNLYGFMTLVRLDSHLFAPAKMRMKKPFGPCRASVRIAGGAWLDEHDDLVIMVALAI